MSDRIEDLIDEQDAARVLDRREDILAAALKQPDEARSVHLAAQAMASELAEYLDVVTGRMSCIGMPSSRHLERLRDYARQLEAHHLDFLDRLNPA